MENPNSVVYPNHPIEVWGNVIDLSMVWMRFILLDDIPILSKRLSSFPQQIGVFRSWEGPLLMAIFYQQNYAKPLDLRCLQVCLDWQPLETLRTRVSATVMSAAQYAAACDRGIAGSTA